MKYIVTNPHMRHNCFKNGVNMCQSKVNALSSVGMPNFVSSFVKQFGRMPSEKACREAPLHLINQDRVKIYLDSAKGGIIDE